MQSFLRIVKKYRYLLAIVLLPLLAVLTIGVPKHASAWANSNGQNFDKNSLNGNFFNAHFAFLDTQTIQDTGTGQKYITASIPAFDLSNGSNGDAFIYWPVDPADNKTPLSAPKNGNCPGGFLIRSIGGTVDWISPKVDPGGSGGCTVNNKPVGFYLGNVRDKVNDILNASEPGTEFELGAAQLHILASPFAWQNNSIITVVGWNAQTVILGGTSTPAGALQKIKDDLNKHKDWGSVKDLGDINSVKIFSSSDSNGCFDQGKSAYKAFLAVRPDNTVAHVFHYTDGDPSKDLQDNWKDDQQKCLFGNQIYSHNPGSEVLGQGQSDTLVYLSNVAVSTKPCDQTCNTVVAAGGSSGGGPSETGTELECENGGGALGWFLCPVIKALNGAINTMDGFINNELNIDVDQYFGTSSSTSTSLYSLWSAFRTLSLSLLVIVALIMVISQALDIGPLDAYTVKKIMPRIVAAVILISLSWELGRFFVQLSNDLGKGVTDILYSVVGASSGSPVSLASVKLSVTGGLLTTGVFAIGGLALGVLGLLSFVATAALAILIGLLVIIFRRLIVVVCVVTAPLAFVSFIMPGTQRIWKFWRESFQGALVVFPLITGMIAAGHVLAQLESNLPQSGASTLLQDIIVLVLYVGPYFILPLVFKFASGVMSSLGGMINDRGRGAFDRLKGFRANRAKENWQKTRNYERFSDRNRFARGLNTALGAGANPLRDLRRGRAGINAGRQTGRVLQGAANLENDQTWSANENDDQFLLAVANEKLAQQKIDAAYRRSRDMSLSAEERNGAQAEYEARSSAMANARRVKSRRSSATRLAALNKLSSTGYQFSAGDAGYQELSDTVASITGGYGGAYSAAMNQAQFNLKNAGRSDLGGLNHGAVNDIKSGVRKLTNAQRGQGKTDTYHGAAGAWLGNSVVDESGKTGSAEQMAIGMKNAAMAGEGPSDEDILQYQSMLLQDHVYANDVNKIEIEKQLRAIDLYADGGPNLGPADPRPVYGPATGNPSLAQRLAANKQSVRRGPQDDPRIAGDE